MRRHASMIFTLFCVLTPTIQADTYLFDMGTKNSELRDGFRRVTASDVYSPRAGFGWKRPDGLHEQYKHYGREWVYSESRGRKYPPVIYTNEVTCDAIYSSKVNQFLVDVAPGRYTVWLLCGRSSGSTREYHDFTVAVGESSSRIQIPGPYIFEKRIFKCDVKKGPLAIGFHPETDWMTAGVMVVSEQDLDAVDVKTIRPLEQETFFLPPEEAAKWIETQHADPRQPPEYARKDRERGYAIFAKHWSEVIYPNTVPRADELNPKLQLFAAWGEYEPVTLTIRPFRDLGDCAVTVSDLKSPDGVVESKQIVVRSVRYMKVRPNYSTYYAYHVAPDVLEKRAMTPIRADVNQRFWMTVHVPDDATAGIYRGTVTFRPQNKDACKVPIELRVLPIQLRKNPQHIYGMYYRDPLSYLNDGNTKQANDYFRRKAEWERQDMVTHGMNSHISSVTGVSRDESGHWAMDGTETERRIALDRKYGLADHPLVVHFPVETWYRRLVDPRGLGSHMRLVRPDVPQSFFDEVTKMVEAIEREKKKHDWPEFLYYPIDEPSRAADAVRFMVNVMKAIKKVPGVRTYVTADPSHEQFEPMWPYVDVWCCQPFVFGYDKIKRLSKERSIEFWCYPNHISGENDHTPVRGARMTWGFGFWKSGFRTLIPWIYQASQGDPWNYLDGSSMDFFNRSTPQGEPIPVTLWEAYREGIDDGRYLYTLQQLIEKRKGQGGARAELAAAAAGELDRFWNAIEIQEKYKYDDLWSGPDFDAYRWLLASWILKLQ